MPFETSPLRLWKSLPRDVRETAARAFWSRPPGDVVATAAHEIVKILRVRPQAFHKIPLESRVRALAGLAHPPDEVAEGLLIALHLEERRGLLAAFLDAFGIAHEDGLIDEDAEVPEITPEAARQALATLRAEHDADAIRVYWNALWLQDPGRWAALEAVESEI